MVFRTSRHAIVATPAGGLAITAFVRDHAVQTDQPIRAGGNDSAPTPLELLSVSLASCVALYVRKFCDTRNLACDDLAVEVKPVWREDDARISRFDVILHVDGCIPEEYLPELEYIARTCPVHNTLMQSPEMTVRIDTSSEAAATV